MLPIKLDHVERLTTLPFHHRDPFDHMLVAQALIESISLISADASSTRYWNLLRVVVRCRMEPFSVTGGERSDKFGRIRRASGTRPYSLKKTARGCN